MSLGQASPQESPVPSQMSPVSQEPPTVRTTVLVLSKTYGLHLDLSAYKPDLVIHCGDLTRGSGRDEYVEAAALLKSIDAPLKIVIPGFNDRILHLTQDPSIGEPLRSRIDEVADMFREQDPTGRNRTTLHTGPRVYSVELPNCGYLRYFAGPYTPPPHREARFVMDEDCDIAVTYGPPYSILDEVEAEAGGVERNLGSVELLESIFRSKPRVHCFGQVARAWGSCLGVWKDNTPGATTGELEITEALEWTGETEPTVLVAPGMRRSEHWVNKDTLFVNAAMGDPEGPVVRPFFLVEIDLPTLRPPGWYPDPVYPTFPGWDEDMPLALENRISVARSSVEADDAHVKREKSSSLEHGPPWTIPVIRIECAEIKNEGAEARSEVAEINHKDKASPSIDDTCTLLPLFDGLPSVSLSEDDAAPGRLPKRKQYAIGEAIGESIDLGNLFDTEKRALKRQHMGSDCETALVRKEKYH